MPVPVSSPEIASAPARVTLRVLFFSVLREQTGHAEQTLALDAPATGATLLDHLEQQHPAVAPYRSVIRLAVNQAYAPDDVRLHDGDEVALITPVSGG